MTKRMIVIALILAVFCGMLYGCTAKQDAIETKETASLTGMQKSDPGKDDTLNILMIGNSYCFYYVEELYGMLESAGIKANVCNVYYSGCPLKKHWEWLMSGEANYSFFTTNEKGRNEIEGVNLEFCLKQQNWDVITLQDGGSGLRDKGVERHLEATKVYLDGLWGYIKEQYPLSKYYWHQTWTFQAGYDRNDYQMTNLEQQRESTLQKKAFAQAVCERYEVGRINSGEAWQIVRDGGYDNLCARKSVNGGAGDNSHDGDIGGGQYVNACVWFEVLTGQSCIGNTWRPNYALDEELISKFQQAAHDAVEQMKTEQ